MTAMPYVFNGAVSVPANAQNLPTACSLCSHNCGLRVDVEDNKIVAVRADDRYRPRFCNAAPLAELWCWLRVVGVMKRRDVNCFDTMSAVVPGPVSVWIRGDCPVVVLLLSAIASCLDSRPDRWRGTRGVEASRLPAVPGGPWSGDCGVPTGCEAL